MADPIAEIPSGEAEPLIDVEASTRQAQLNIIERTSRPGAYYAGLGAVVVGLYAAFGDGAAGARGAFAATALCAAVMSALWVWTLRACRRGDLPSAYVAQLAANLISAALFLFFVKGGVVLGLTTAFVGVFTGATVIAERQQRMVWLLTSLVVLLALAGREAQLVGQVELPAIVLYLASAVSVVLVFRTPVAAQRAFDRHLRANRAEALRLARLANQQRDRADAQARDLARVTEELRDFTYFVSHDLRAPLINIEGFAKVLEETIEDLERTFGDDAVDIEALRAAWQESRADIEESLQFICGGTLKLNALVAGLLELSRIDSRPAESVPVALDPLLEQIAESMQHQIRDRSIELDVDRLPTIVGDPLRIGQVFGNLIDNAIKYMPNRDPRRIAVTCEEHGEDFLFSVTDSGAGIPEDQRRKVFRPFQRLDGGKGASGEGLGLAAVRKIVERAGGRIWVEDAAEGPGASFRFTWPRPEADSPAEQQHAA